MRFLIINGPNLNLLGRREPEIYGAATYDDLCRTVRDWAEAHGHSAAFAHYSYAIHDALRAVTTPAAEVHITDIHAREEWRSVSVTAPACRGMVCGMGFAGYCRAMEMLV